ncbi:MAG: type II secretion system GspH family protein [Candidatus Magnetominusculus sp. LBB02]|nr:type II secretion system GspH family protein [Candidatus Magnetominusculus sp. LBB02]
MIRRANEKGFTLVEIVAVLVLLGILSKVAMSQFSKPDSFQVVSEMQTLRTNLRFAQLKAMSGLDTVTWGINLGTGSYQLYNNGAAAATALPGDNTSTHTFPTGLTASAAATITFDNWGSPGTSSITITLTKGAYSKSTTITQNTGFMQ